MLRRLASLGHTASDDQLPTLMSPSPGDDQDARTPGGLAGVFKGLAGGGKLTKSPPPSHPSLVSIAASQPITGRNDASVALPTGLRGLGPDQAELYGQLKNKTVALSERVAAANSLRYAIADFPLNPILDIWDAGKDLIEPEKPAGARHVGWELLTECVKCPTSTELERREYYDTLTAQAHPEDFHLQLAALEDLTNKGRNVSGFPYDIFPLLVKWLQDAYKAVRTARRNAQRGPGRPAKGVVLGEDKNFSQLFAFFKDVIKFNSKFAREGVVGLLLDLVLRICMNTSYENDLRMCIGIMDSLVTFGTIPNNKLKDCVQVLSSIHCLVPQLKKEAWHTISNICRSHHGQSTVRILLGVLRNYSPAQDDDETVRKEKEKELVREVRGALSVLKKLLFKSAEKGYPAISLVLLMDGLEHVSATNSTRIATEILALINKLLDDPDTNDISAMVAEEHWGMIFAVAAQCATRVTAAAVADPDTGLQSPLSKDDSESDNTVTQQLVCLLTRIEKLLVQKGTDFMQRDECLEFLIQVHQALPDSTAGLVITYFKEYRSCLPSDTDWKKNLAIALDGFYLNRNRDPLTRLHALEVVIEVYNFLSLAEDLVDDKEVVDLIRRLLAGMSQETNSLVLQETVTFLVKVAESATPSLFDDILDGLKKVVSQEMAKSPLAMLNAPKAASYGYGQTIYVANQSLSNVVTRGYVQIFIRTMNHDGPKASKAFIALVHIARSNSCELDARLTAMKMLFRLRADSEHQIYLSTRTENESLAGSLYRTETSLARKLAEDAAQPSRLSRAEQGLAPRASRGVSFTQAQTGDKATAARQSHIPKPIVPQAQRLWSVPDAEALPEPPPERPSWVLVSYRDYEDGGADLFGPARVVLNMSTWLEALLSLFHNGCDWEVYSFVLVHLPNQLSNHPIFRGAITYIHEIRRFFCEMIKSNSCQEPPNSSGLRRTDVSNCLFHSLTMILSYHEYFQKADEDDLVRTFTHGIGEKTAKTCIHALQVCCHELDTSVSKSLVTILQKMSQVITQPLVAMHILEFLACLSRLPNLYRNFREDEYRIIFGICARYLQSVRDKKQSAARSSHTSEPSTPGIAVVTPADLSLTTITDDLPQYVHALAYHVITFWFLAVKLHDRPNHIPWIAKNLFVDSDGKATNEDQAIVTLDFMQRVAFSDACDSAQDSLFNEDHYGEIQKRRWIIGNSIVTIRQAKETGWAEITRRYPSGTSSFVIRVEFSPLPNPTTAETEDAASEEREGRFQHGVTIGPSHLLMQLLAPMPQMSDPAIRPIPLPDEDGVNRSIRNFDRNSTVDGHKVGVIYIGDGQTNEVEILANTIGGPDYLTFLKGLGSLTRLKGATFNTQGLDRENDIDGRYTYCWRDRVTEIVFHVTTQMPTNLEHDPQCIMKKRHIGNDFVNIIWNDSGLPFRFDQFPSQFNYVYIVITPTPRRSFAATRELASQREAGEQAGKKSHSPFYMVQVMSAPGFPEISPAAEPKLVSLGALPRLVRLMALNASVFSLVWANREGEHVSSWRNRLQEINRLRERYGPKVLHPGGGSAGSLQPNALAAAAAAAAGGISGFHQMGQSVSGAGSIMTMDSMMAGGGSGMSRPPSGMRDSFSSLRRSSVATFFTSGGSTTDPTSHRSSLLSTTTTDNTEIMQVNATEALVDSVDFSKWT
ncbi:hypothetical protein QBC35DRAFT_494192 [Podospora australis]|uniref:Rap-GAP domain-containing protein n=1 Tax=Podospora australis TaxID=1536484 RepID=A0AAN6WW74_9PEZI|nr:hypothetical protein QBC35DRAFT_494192 [Podospora australis]